jgi:hypothetical protein
MAVVCWINCTLRPKNCNNLFKELQQSVEGIVAGGQRIAAICSKKELQQPIARITAGGQRKNCSNLLHESQPAAKELLQFFA